MSNHDPFGSGPNRIFYTFPPLNWKTILIALPFIILGLMLFSFFFTFILIIFLVSAVVFAVRFWWIKRKFNQAYKEAKAQQSGNIHVIEGEYVIIEKRKSDGISNDEDV